MSESSSKHSPFALRLGDLSVDLPTGWEHEIDVSSKAPPIDGYRPNIRIVVRCAPKPPALDALVDEYANRLSQQLAGRVDLGRRTVPEGLSPSHAAQMSYSIELSDGRRVVHVAIIAVVQRGVITVSTSHPAALEGTEVARTLRAALDSVRA